MAATVAGHLMGRLSACSECLRLAVGKREFGVADGDRTHDNRNHNPGLYH